MNIKQYIESGILENYVFGLLTDQERREVDQYSKEYPEIKQELEEIENTLADYAQLHEVVPPDHIKAKVLEEIDRLSKPSNNLNSGKDLGNNFGMLGLLGALLLLAAAGAFYFYNQSSAVDQELNNRNQQLVICESSNNNCEEEKAALLQQNQGLEELVVFLRNETTKVTVMNPTSSATQATARVCWNPNTKQAFVDIGTLAPLPSNKQYQLWAIVADGEDEGSDPDPKSMDIIKLDKMIGPMIKVNFVEGAVAYAISIEDAGEEKQSPSKNIPLLGYV